MNKKINQFLLPLAIGFILISIAIISNQTPNQDLQNMPSLPKPIAKEMVLITSAGQSTDTYIIKDIANKLMIHNYFMPQASTLDLDDIQSVVFVVGYSEINDTLFDTTYENEIDRIKKLIDSCNELDLTVITVFIGGEHRKDAKTVWMLDYIGTNSDYIITTADGDKDHSLYKLANELKIPFTIVNKLDDISEPFASAFR
ncbi:MAG TPA: DUF6305 family protein [Fusibacter sp.]|nr:DUF6305 family protein [Fusibacter sp.]